MFMNEMFSNNKQLKSLDLSYFNTESLESMTSAFSGCENLGSIIIPNTFNTEKVENMKGLFKDCKKLTSLNLAGFRTEKVVDMSQMFQDCSKLTYIDISNFETKWVEESEVCLMDVVL